MKKLILLCYVISFNTAFAQTIYQAKQAINEYAKTRKKVITFIGYSGKGYENQKRMLRIAKRQLRRIQHKNDQWIVNIGVTPDGIGVIYTLAKEMGFETRGIVSKNAIPYLTSVKDVDQYYLIDDEHWGGAVGGELTPTSEAMIAVSDKVVTIGGGDVAYAETCAAQSRGIKTQVYCAKMNEEKAIKKAAKKGLPTPTYFHGKGSELARFCLRGAKQAKCSND
jgi:hypothetical protein